MDLKLPYIAGLIDADGSISIIFLRKQRRYYPGVGFGCYGSEEILEELKRRYGGSFGNRIKKRKLGWNKEPMPRWSISDNKAILFLKEILPFLILKKEQAVLAIKLKEEGDWTPGSKKSVDEMERRESLRKKVHDLNRKNKPYEAVVWLPHKP